MTILDDASKAVVARGESYGTPAETHGRTAAMWSAYLGVKVTAFDVCMLNIMQKVSRAKCDPIHRDNLVDVAGYAENAERCGPMLCPVPEVEIEKVDIGKEFSRGCVMCGASIPARKAILERHDGMRFVAAVWQCRCGWKWTDDMELLALDNPRIRNVPPFLPTPPAVAPVSPASNSSTGC